MIDPTRRCGVDAPECLYLGSGGCAAPCLGPLRADAERLREVLNELLSASLLTYHLERDNPSLIARATALAAGPVEVK